MRLLKHESLSEVFNLRMTKTERKMLRTLAVRSAAGSDSGWLRKAIREAWAKKEEKKLQQEDSAE